MTTFRCAPVLVAVVLAVAACGGPGTKAEPPTLPAGEVALRFAEAQILRSHNPVFKVHADGSTETRAPSDYQWVWIPGPTFTSNGKIKIDGVEKAHLTGSEIVAEGSDTRIPFRILADKVVSADPQGNPVEFSLDAEGVVAISNTQSHGDPVRVEAASAEDRHAGLVVFTATFLMLNGFGKVTSTTPMLVPAAPVPPLGAH